MELSSRVEVDDDEWEWEEVGKKSKKGTSEDKQKKIKKLQQAYLSQFWIHYIYFIIIG